jgi:hypothetical protein
MTKTAPLPPVPIAHMTGKPDKRRREGPWLPFVTMCFGNGVNGGAILGHGSGGIVWSRAA